MLGDSLRRRHPGPGGKKDAGAEAERPSGSGRRFTWLHWTAASVVVLLVSFGVGYLISTLVLFPRPETAGTGVPVPDLRGEDRAGAEARLQTAGLILAGVEYLPSEEADSGRVLGQDPVPGQELRRGAAVKLAVSAGPARVHVPAVAGLSARTAAELLAGVGLEVRTVPAQDGGAAPGLAQGTDPGPGEVVERSATVTLRVGQGGGPAPDAGATTPDAPSGAGADTLDGTGAP